MPPSDPGSYTVREHAGVAVIELSGDVDGSAERPLTAAWEDAMALGPAAVALAFDRVGYINSTGIALLVGLLSRARARGLSLRVFGLDPHYREIFEITRLADFVAIHDDENGAISAPVTASTADRGNP